MVKKDKFQDKTHSEILQMSQELLSEISDHVGPKEIEQHLLEMLLRNDGYFADEFTAEEFVTMKYNISNDFPIFLNTHVNELKERLEEAVSESAGLHNDIAGLENQIEDFVKTLKVHRDVQKKVLDFCVSPALQQSADRIELILGLYSAEKIIMAKLHTGCSLTEKEVKLVASKL
jgi:uncharacterized protein YoxC